MTEPNRILCIEDNPTNWRLVQRLLGQAGYDTYWAKEGLEGFDQALQLDPDLVLLDINLPGLSGYEIATKFREDERLRRIPLVALTAKTLKSERETALVAGCTGFIPKPIDPFTFVEQVQGYLSGHRESVEKGREREALRTFNVTMVEHLEAQLKEAHETNQKLSQAQRELEIRNRSLSRLVSLGQTFLMRPNAGALVERVMEDAQAATHATSIVAYRLHPSGGYWHGVKWEDSAIVSAPTLPFDHEFCLRLTALDPDRLYYGEALRSQRIWEEGLEAGFWRSGMEGGLMVLRDAQSPTGIWGFWCFGRKRGEPFESFEIELAALHASLARVSLENAELIASLQESGQALASSYEHMEMAFHDLQKAKAELSRQDRRALLDDLFYKLAQRLIQPVRILDQRSREMESYTRSGDDDPALVEIREAVRTIDGLLKALMRRTGKEGASVPEWLDLHELLQQEMELLTAEGVIPPEAKVSLELESQASRLFGVYGDFAKLFQNLLVHSFTGPEPSPSVRIRTWMASDWFHLDISDEGGPIPPSLLVGAFEPFNELHQPVVGGVRHPGATLPLCRQLLAAYHGEIELHNDLEGTTVQVQVPLM